MMRAALILAVSAMSGCSTLFPGFSGLTGSKSQLTCKAPDGVLCTSVSGNYANSLADNLPGQLPQAAAGISTPSAAGALPPQAATAPMQPEQPYFSPRDLTAPNSGDPVRMAPLVLRVWFAPWEDKDGDLHDQHYVYTVVHTGKWLIEANRDAISKQYRPVYPLKGNAPSKEEAAKEAEIPEGFGAAPTRPAPGAAE